VSGTVIVLDVLFGRRKPYKIDGGLLIVVADPAIETDFTVFVKCKSSKIQAVFAEDVASGTATVLAEVFGRRKLSRMDGVLTLSVIAVLEAGRSTADVTAVDLSVLVVLFGGYELSRTEGASTLFVVVVATVGEIAVFVDVFGGGELLLRTVRALAFFVIVGAPAGDAVVLVELFGRRELCKMAGVLDLFVMLEAVVVVVVVVVGGAVRDAGVGAATETFLGGGPITTWLAC